MFQTGVFIGAPSPKNLVIKGVRSINEITIDTHAQTTIFAIVDIMPRFGQKDIIGLR